jgi:hypothetical protein
MNDHYPRVTLIASEETTLFAKHLLKVKRMNQLSRALSGCKNQTLLSPWESAYRCATVPVTVAVLEGAVTVLGAGGAEVVLIAPGPLSPWPAGEETVVGGWYGVLCTPPLRSM